ncbi:hypothetical protein N752_11970 [Desulforamulus aquiferis]|nr:hypothetical protein N752_11970 [Desulforamulus aquiferis]
MDKPGEAKYGFTRSQLTEGFIKLKNLGVKHFGLHAFLASNTTTNEYYPELARILFKTAVELNRETGAHISFINLSGGVGIPYRPEQNPADIMAIGEGVRQAYNEVLVPAGMDDVAIYTELGRFMLGPYGCLVTTAIHEKHIHKEYIGLDACAANLMRPACMVHIIISRLWERKISPATTNMTLQVGFAKTMINLPLIACCRKLTLEIWLSYMTPEPRLCNGL